MKEIVIKSKKIWVVFNDKKLLSKPICKVQTADNNEEYYLGIHLLQIRKFAINENQLIEKIEGLQLYNLSQFINHYSSK